MKRIILIALLAALLLAACAGKETPGFGAEDLALEVGGARRELGEDIGDVIAVMGDGYEYAEARSCDYDGLDKTFSYAAARFYTFPLPQGDTVSEIYTEDAAVQTTKGLAVGASRADVLAAYGDGGEDTGYQLIYRLAGGEGSLCFDIENDVVTAVYVTSRPF